MGGYTIPSVKTEYNGTIYASKMEARFAKLLVLNNIDFIYSVWVEVDEEDGKHFREIDFFCNRGLKPYWVSNFTNCWECKGVLQPSDYTRMKALRDQGIETFIVTEPVLKYWEEYGFLQHKMGKIKKKRTKDNNEIEF